jgi:AcrR family transcriptional regulator
MDTTTVRKGEATHDRILEAAYQLFLKQGYHATSMRQIVDQAGITMGGIYNHYPSKEAIWEEVLIARHPYHEIIPLLKSAEGETIAEYIKNAAEHLVSELGRRDDLLNLMFIELVEFNGKHIPGLFNLIVPEINQLFEVFKQKRGKLRPNTLQVLIRSFAGLFFSYYFTDIMMPKELHPLMGENSLGAFVNIYLYGILEEPEGDRHA